MKTVAQWVPCMVLGLSACSFDAISLPSGTLPGGDIDAAGDATSHGDSVGGDVDAAGDATSHGDSVGGDAVLPSGWFQIDGSATDRRPGVATSTATGEGFSTGGASGREPSLVVDSKGQPIIAFEQAAAAGARGIRTLRWQQGSWRELDRVEGSSTEAISPALALSDNDVLYLAWLDGSGIVKAAEWKDGTGWVNRLTKAVDGVGRPRITVRHDGVVAVIYPFFAPPDLPSSAVQLFTADGTPLPEISWPGVALFAPDITVVEDIFYAAFMRAPGPSSYISVFAFDEVMSGSVGEGGATRGFNDVFGLIGGGDNPRIDHNGTHLFVAWQQNDLVETEVLVATFDLVNKTWDTSDPGVQINLSTGLGGVSNQAGTATAHAIGALPDDEIAGPRVSAVWTQDDSLHVLDADTEANLWFSPSGSLFADGTVLLEAEGSTGLAVAPGDFDDHFVAWSRDTGVGERVYMARYDCKSLWMDYAIGANNGISGTDACSENPAMVMQGGRPSIAWHERTGRSRWDVYFKTTSGGGWSEVSGSASGYGLSTGASAGFPAVAHGESEVWVAWQQVFDTAQILVKKLEGGSNWVGVAGSDETSGISSSPYHALFPSIALLSDGSPVVAWLAEDAAGYFHPYVRQYGIDSGAGAWSGLGGSDTGDGLGNGGSARPPIRLAVDGSDRIHVAWVEINSSGARRLHVKRWDSANVWSGLNGNGPGLVPTTGQVAQPALAVHTDGTVHLAWRQGLTEGTQIYYQHSASSWTQLGSSATARGVSNTAGHAIEPTIALTETGLPVIAWADNSPGGWDIYLKQWQQDAWTEIDGSATGRGISGTEPHSRQPVLAADSGRLCVTWVDGGLSAPEISLRCYDQ